MLNFMVNAEGGLTTAGYAICIVLGIVVFGIALFFASKNSEKNKGEQIDKINFFRRCNV